MDIALEQGVPGIVGAFQFRPETAKPMRDLAEILLRGPNTLASAEREAIVAYVSKETIAVLPAVAQRGGGGASRRARRGLRVDRAGEGASGECGGFAEAAGAAADRRKGARGRQK